MTGESLLFVVHGALLIAAAGLALMVLMLSVEIIASLVITPRAMQAMPRASCSYVVVVPAHDEVGTI